MTKSLSMSGGLGP